MIRIEVISGSLAGQAFDLDKDSLRVGRSPSNDLVLTDELVSGDHALIQRGTDGVELLDLRSTNGTTVLRGGTRIGLGEENARRIALQAGDVIELGSEAKCVQFKLTWSVDSDIARIVALKHISDLESSPSIVEKDDRVLPMLYDALKQIGAAEDLSDVFVCVCEASFALVPLASHVTIVMRDDDLDTGDYVPVLTRIRGQVQTTGPVPITRSVVRKVLSERAAVLAADAPGELGNSESMMGAQIRSTMGIPLWRGDDILGVLQVDNRGSAGMFLPHDLEKMAVLANNASLAVANARLLQKLRVAEERMKKENAFLKGRERERRTGSRVSQTPVIIGESNAIRSLLAQLDRVVDTRVAVLVEGETGVGKELVASSVHYRSRRKDRLFVAQNCAAMPENLLESELFGHKKGSFTGAHEDKKGLFEIADGGTLFLDEVTEMPISLQSKLLRVLQEGEIRPVGATQERKVDVRIVAATNRNLEKEVAEGRFREDLYYRLKVFPLRVPPLRERRDDIPLLANFFLKKNAVEMGRSSPGFAQQTLEVMQSYEWPGNVRELSNEVQRLAIQVEPGAYITPDLLSPRVRQIENTLGRIKPEKGTLKEMTDQVERYLLIEALREQDNNKTAAAKVLGITREGLHKKLRQYGL